MGGSEAYHGAVVRPPKYAVRLSGRVVPVLVVVAIGAVYLQGMVAVVGLTLGLTAGVPSALSRLCWRTRTLAALLTTVAAVAGVLVAGQAWAAAALVAILGLSQTRLNRRADGLGTMVPVVAAVFASAHLPALPWMAGVWTAGGIVLVHVLVRLFRLPTRPTPVDPGLARRHARVFAVVAGGVFYLMLLAGIGHAYWLVLTLAVVLRPVSGETRAAGRQRAAGTVTGAVLAVIAAALLPGLVAAVLALPALVLMVAWAVAGDSRRQALFNTPVVLLVSSAGVWDRGVELATERILFTLAGVGLAVLAVVAVEWWDRRHRLSLTDELE